MHVLPRGNTAFAVAVLVALLAFLAVGSARADAAAIPPPEQYFGFQPGTSGKLVRFSKMEDYYRLIADKSNRVNFESLGGDDARTTSR